MLTAADAGENKALKKASAELMAEAEEQLTTSQAEVLIVAAERDALFQRVAQLQDDISELNQLHPDTIDIEALAVVGTSSPMGKLQSELFRLRQHHQLEVHELRSQLATVLDTSRTSSHPAAISSPSEQQIEALQHQLCTAQDETEQLQARVHLLERQLGSVHSVRTVHQRSP